MTAVAAAAWGARRTRDLGSLELEPSDNERIVELVKEVDYILRSAKREQTYDESKISLDFTRRSKIFVKPERVSSAAVTEGVRKAILC